MKPRFAVLRNGANSGYFVHTLMYTVCSFFYQNIQILIGFIQLNNPLFIQTADISCSDAVIFVPVETRSINNFYFTWRSSATNIKQDTLMR